MRFYLNSGSGLELGVAAATAAIRGGVPVVGAVVAALASLVLATWAGGDTALASLAPGWRVMVPSTAFGFIWIGLGIAVFASGTGFARGVPPALAALAAVLPVATLLEYATGSRWGTENWLGIRFPADSAVAGRMSPLTSLALVLLATSLAALPCRTPIGEGVVRLAAGTSLAVSWLAVLAVAFDAARLADVPAFPGMAVLTVALLAVSSAAILSSSAHTMARLRGAQLQAAFAPIPLLAVFLLPLALGQARGLLSRYLDPGLATGLVVIAFAMALAAVVWRTLARLQTFQLLRDRLLAELGARVNERTQALEEANRQLHHSEGRLREADRRKDEFLATLAHELRNPLAPIRTGLEILRADAVAPEAASHAHQVIGRQLRHLVRLIDDLLDVSRITANKLELRVERLSISEVLHQSVETSRADLDRARQTLTLGLTPEPAFVLGDPTRLTQIVANLLQNACKYTPSGGHISLTATRRGAHVELRVRDNGIGIATADLPRLFEKFSQLAPGHERGGGGLGLGLALVRGLVSLHGGVVEVHSDGIGRGSEFVVRLPAADGPGISTPPTFDVAPASGPSRRVLVVDDNIDNADALALYLRQRGHLVATAYDGDAACRVAERFRPDVVLLDIGLPKVNGHDVCQFIRLQPWGATMRIIAQTGWGQEADRLRSRHAGFDAHLVKPVDPAALTQLVAAT